MIISFKHKGLEHFLTGSTAGIQAVNKSKLARILARVDSTQTPNDINLPAWVLHQLSGNLAGCWSVKVNGKLAHDL